MRVLGTGSHVAREEPGLVLETSGHLDGDPPEGSKFDRPRVREVGRRAEEVLLVQLGVLGRQPGDLQLEKHGADREEPGRLLEVPGGGVLRVRAGTRR